MCLFLHLCLYLNGTIDYVYRLFLFILLRLYVCAIFWICSWQDDVLWCSLEEQVVARQFWSMINYRVWKMNMHWQSFPSITTQPQWCFKESWRGHWRKKLVNKIFHDDLHQRLNMCNWSEKIVFKGCFFCTMCT